MARETKAEKAGESRFTFQTKTHGAGGFANVIRGRDNLLEREIAVKVLNPLATKFSEPEQERFRREARILATLSHPNIPAIYDVDFSPGTFLIIFQFIEGPNLGELIEEEGPCDVGAVKSWFQQIASALDHAHQRGVVHRDIKPDNIIITPDRASAYLVDFGIALSAEDLSKLTRSGYVMGTPGYMSPEQIAGEAIDWRSDIFSLAVTLYEALAGKPIPVGEYQELSNANEAIPPQIDTLINDCLRSKDNRLVTPRVLSTRLAGALQPLRPLSEVLAHGPLHELAAAIEEISPDEFTQLPQGQRELILIKIADLVESDKPQLEFATERFLDLMLYRGITLDGERYRGIVVPSIRWAFERKFDGYIGRPNLRRALEGAASVSRGASHEVLCEEFGKFINERDLESQDEWFLHAVRPIVQTLLANPACGTQAGELGRILRGVNEAQRSRTLAVKTDESASASPP